MTVNMRVFGGVCCANDGQKQWQSRCECDVDTSSLLAKRACPCFGIATTKPQHSSPTPATRAGSSLGPLAPPPPPCPPARPPPLRSTVFGAASASHTCGTGYSVFGEGRRKERELSCSRRASSQDETHPSNLWTAPPPPSLAPSHTPRIPRCRPLHHPPLIPNHSHTFAAPWAAPPRPPA